jgi:hypothetical protein
VVTRRQNIGYPAKKFWLPSDEIYVRGKESEFDRIERRCIYFLAFVISFAVNAFEECQLERIERQLSNRLI